MPSVTKCATMLEADGACIPHTGEMSGLTPHHAKAYTVH